MVLCNKLLRQRWRWPRLLPPAHAPSTLEGSSGSVSSSASTYEVAGQACRPPTALSAPYLVRWAASRSCVHHAASGEARRGGGGGIGVGGGGGVGGEPCPQDRQSVSRHVSRHMCRHVSRHVCRHVPSHSQPHNRCTSACGRHYSCPQTQKHTHQHTCARASMPGELSMCTSRCTPPRPPVGPGRAGQTCTPTAGTSAARRRCTYSCPPPTELCHALVHSAAHQLAPQPQRQLLRPVQQQ